MYFSCVCTRCSRPWRDECNGFLVSRSEFFSVHLSFPVTSRNSQVLFTNCASRLACRIQFHARIYRPCALPVKRGAGTRWAHIWMAFDSRLPWGLLSYPRRHSARRVPAGNLQRAPRPGVFTDLPPNRASFGLYFSPSPPVWSSSRLPAAAARKGLSGGSGSAGRPRPPARAAWQAAPQPDAVVIRTDLIAGCHDKAPPPHAA